MTFRRPGSPGWAVHGIPDSFLDDGGVVDAGIARGVDERHALLCRSQTQRVNLRRVGEQLLPVAPPELANRAGS